MSGHGPLLPDGSVPKGLLGKVGGDVSETDAYEGARLTGLAILSSLQRALGDLDRVTGWLRVFGMVNVAPGFTRTPAVINGFSGLIIDLWGPEAGAHARSAIGVAELPLEPRRRDRGRGGGGLRHNPSSERTPATRRIHDAPCPSCRR